RQLYEHCVPPRQRIRSGRQSWSPPVSSGGAAAPPVASGGLLTATPGGETQQSQADRGRVKLWFGNCRQRHVGSGVVDPELLACGAGSREYRVVRETAEPSR